MNIQEYTDLKKTIEYHMDRYYNLDQPEISDHDYDLLMQRLKAAEREHPEWVGADSPSQKVGGTVRRGAGVKVSHNVPMLSIEDVFTHGEVSAWVDKVHVRCPGAAFSVEGKIDGLSMTVRYRRGEDGRLHLVLAESRGDGYTGEDVTANAREIPDVPEVIDLPYESLELRGEVYMTRDAFARYNKEMEQKGGRPAANPRNLAAGTLRQLDPSVTRSRGLNLFVFNVQSGPQEVMCGHTAALDLLAGYGVPVVLHRRCVTRQEVLDAIDEIGSLRESLPYDLDGAVVKLDDTALRELFPSGSKYSPGHIAYKYPPEERTVTMDRILVDVGRTGKITFTGEFHDTGTGKAARLCGTNVSRATLHNQDYINEMRIGVGGQYRVFKSGEIIPKLSGCVREPEEVYRAPSFCPVCGERLVREEDTADIRCVNPSCPAQLSRTIVYFASRECMNIMGLGETLVDALVKEGYLSSYADIYDLKNHREELIAKGIIGREKNTDKVLEAIDRSRDNSPVLLLTGLGIRNCGKAAARGIFSHYGTLEEVAGAAVEELTSIPDIGETTAECIYRFFRNETNRAVLARLREAGVNMTMTASQPEGSRRLEGMTIVVTGTLPSLGRREAQELIVSHGGKAAESVSKKTSYVLAGDNAGAKLARAQQLGIPIISEEEFMGMLELHV